MRSKVVLAALLALTVLPSLGADPFADTQSKEEAAAAFAEVEELLAREDTVGLHALYQEWKRTFNITYSLLEDNLRYAYFVQTLRRIIEANTDPSTSHWEGLNQFSAMSDTEFSATYSVPLQRQGQSNNTAPLQTKALLALPRSKNWVAEGKVTPVRSQGGCYCCWAFAGIAALESRALIALKTKASEYNIDLSEQQLVDCARAPKFKYSFGCGGGQLEDPFGFATVYPVVPESLYPYTAKDGSCRRMTTTNGSVSLSGPGYVELEQNSATALKQALMESPIAIAYYASLPSMKNYKGGIYDPPSCGTTYLVDHAVLLVGYDDTTKSWLLKNSWGTQ
ncbi:hypothetical protein N2152v2_006834 [Parachlorella kessleri]